jgi:hypothetical protein
MGRATRTVWRSWSGGVLLDMRDETAAVGRISLRAAGMVVTGLAAFLLVPSLLLFVGLLAGGTDDDQVDTSMLVRLVALGGLPALLLLTGAGYTGLQAARKLKGWSLTWAAGLLVLGGAWTFGWFLAVLSSFSGD